MKGPEGPSISSASCSVVAQVPQTAYVVIDGLAPVVKPVKYTAEAVHPDGDPDVTFGAEDSSEAFMVAP